MLRNIIFKKKLEIGGKYVSKSALNYLSTMKYLLSICFLMSGIASAQDTIRHFKRVEQQVIWEKTYDTEQTAFEVFSALKAKNLFDEPGIVNGQLTGRIKPFDPDVKGAGFSEWTAPVYLSRNTIHGEFTIAYTGKSYVVTIKNMMMVQKYDDPMAKEGEILPLEKVALDREGNLSAGFIKTPAIAIDFTLDKLFKLD